MGTSCLRRHVIGSTNTSGSYNDFCESNDQQWVYVFWLMDQILQHMTYCSPTNYYHKTILRQTNLDHYLRQPTRDMYMSKLTYAIETFTIMCVHTSNIVVAWKTKIFSDFGHNVS